MKRILVHERFNSFQGEGAHVGRSAYFIRTYGCPVRCSFCDSAGTWHPDFVPSRSDLEQARPDRLADAAISSNAGIVVITGGEPSIWDWRSFLDYHRELARERKLIQPVHIETSGAFKLLGAFDWVTVSPKKAKLPLPETLNLADELKLIIESPSDIAYWLEIIAPGYFLASGPSHDWKIYNGADRQVPVWLHPEWTVREDRDVLSAIVKAVKEFPYIFRAGYQLHKLYKADSFDPYTRKETPIPKQVKSPVVL